MTFLKRFFSAPPQPDNELLTIVHRLLDENRELQRQLIELHAPIRVVEPIAAVTEHSDDPDEASVVVGWTTPRQRVRNFINATTPAASLGMLSKSEMEFLANSRQ
jgi:hypothetical protein